MDYNTEREQINTLSKVVTEQDQIIRSQKEMIKNLCTILLKGKGIKDKSLTCVWLN